MRKVTQSTLCPWFGQMATLLILGSTLHYRKMASNSNDQSFYTAANHTGGVRMIFQFRATCLSQRVALSCWFIKMFIAEWIQKTGSALKSWCVFAKRSSPTSAPCGPRRARTQVGVPEATAGASVGTNLPTYLTNLPIMMLALVHCQSCTLHHVVGYRWV